MTPLDLPAVELLVAAFAGGAFGAAVGALPSFALAGLVVIVGELAAILGRTTDAGLASVDITGTVGFGPVLGPHVAFGGGAAALAYAASRDRVETDEGFDYHPAKAVSRGLGSRPDVLAVGGVFGVLGYAIATGAEGLAVPVDPVALGVVGSALAHRLAFGYSIFGAPLGRLLEMSEFDPSRRADGVEVDGGQVVGGQVNGGQVDGGQVDGGLTGGPRSEPGQRVEPWLPYQYRWPDVLALGAVVGVLGAYVAYETASAFLAFGISVVALAFLVADVARIPVTHHVTLPASTAVLATVDAPLGTLTPERVAAAVPLGEALVLGVIFGVVGAALGELSQRVFYAHAETHLDPPAASIVLTSLLIGLLAMAGVFPDAAWIPLP